MPTGAAGRIGEDAESQIPGSFPPSYETGDGEIVMNSRCALCGTQMSPRDLPFGGKICQSCAEKKMAAPGVPHPHLGVPKAAKPTLKPKLGKAPAKASKPIAVKPASPPGVVAPKPQLPAPAPH